MLSLPLSGSRCQNFDQISKQDEVIAPFFTMTCPVGLKGLDHVRSIVLLHPPYNLHPYPGGHPHVGYCAFNNPSEIFGFPCSSH
jgi:hypothetical protein